MLSYVTEMQRRVNFYASLFMRFNLVSLNFVFSCHSLLLELKRNFSSAPYAPRRHSRCCSRYVGKRCRKEPPSIAATGAAAAVVGGGSGGGGAVTDSGGRGGIAVKVTICTLHLNHNRLQPCRRRQQWRSVSGKQRK